jgi:hypothetical protein
MGAAAAYLLNPPAGIDLTESREAANNAIGIVLFALSAAFVALRLLTRLRYQRIALGLDDYLMCIGLVSTDPEKVHACPALGTNGSQRRP